MKIKSLIVDDESHNRENLRISLEKYCPNIEVVGEAATAIEGIDLIKSRQPDLIFLDVEMPHGNGFNVLEGITHIDFEVIFVTAYDQYAIKAIKFCALDYLLKPLKIIELKTAVEKVEQKLKEKRPNTSLEVLINNIRQSQPRIALPTAEQIDFVEIQDIIHCKGENNYTHIHLVNQQKILVSKTLKEYEELLTDYQFIRVHQSHLINKQHVKRFVKKEGGYIVMSNDEQIPVSRHRKEYVFEQLYKL